MTTPQSTADGRMQFIRRILEDVRVTRAVGKEADDEAIIRANPQLMPELRDWLLRLRDEPTVLGPNPQAPAAGPKGTRQRLQIPGYSLIKEIGRGGQAVVFLALQLNTGRKVAVKVVSQGSLADDRALARMKREAQVLASLNHPNIVTILDTGVTSSGARYIVMNFIEGATLDEFMRDRVEYSDDPSELLRLFMKICTAIHAAHAHGIIHRDLKPSNIRVDERGEPQILDFGLARTSLDRLLQGSKRPVSITGEFLGSLPWCSPEQARGDPNFIDKRTDVYSLGVILYQMITGGRFPYEVAGNIANVLNNIISAQPTPPSQNRDQSGIKSKAAQRDSRPPINRTIEAIVLKALEKSPEARYQTTEQFADAIAAYLSGQATADSRNSAEPIAVSGKSRLTKIFQPQAWMRVRVGKPIIALIVVMLFVRGASTLLRTPSRAGGSSLLQRNPAVSPEAALILDALASPCSLNSNDAAASLQDEKLMLRLELARQRLKELPSVPDNLQAIHKQGISSLEQCHLSLEKWRQLNRQVPDYESVAKKTIQVAPGLYKQHHKQALNNSDKIAIADLAVKAGEQLVLGIVNAYDSSIEYDRYRTHYRSLRRQSLTNITSALDVLYATTPKSPTAAITVDLNGSWNGAYATDLLMLRNDTRQSLTNCSLFVQLNGVSGMNGAKQRYAHVHFIDEWPAGTWLYSHYRSRSASGIVQGESVDYIQDVNIRLYSEEIRSEIRYEYSGPEFDADVSRYASTAVEPYLKGSWWKDHALWGSGLDLQFNGTLSYIPTNLIIVEAQQGTLKKPILWTRQNSEFHPGFAGKQWIADKRFQGWSPDQVLVTMAFPHTNYRLSKRFSREQLR